MGNKNGEPTRDLTGQRFGRAVVLEYVRGGKWKCMCDCGNTFVTKTSKLNSGWTKSCGCYMRDRNSEVHKTHGKTKTRLYTTWSHMKDRCNRTTDKSYLRYGGRGIKVCNEWLNSYETFAEWAYNNGYREDLTIDRINNDGDYEPSNCRWVTNKEQSNNRGSNRYLTYKDRTKTLAQWSEETGLSTRAIRRRLDWWGWTVEEALTIPIQSTYHKNQRGIQNGY